VNLLPDLKRGLGPSKKKQNVGGGDSLSHSLLEVEGSQDDAQVGKPIKGKEVLHEWEGLYVKKEKAEGLVIEG